MRGMICGSFVSACVRLPRTGPCSDWEHGRSPELRRASGLLPRSGLMKITPRRSLGIVVCLVASACSPSRDGDHAGGKNAPAKVAAALAAQAPDPACRLLDSASFRARLSGALEN